MSRVAKVFCRSADADFRSSEAASLGGCEKEIRAPGEVIVSALSRSGGLHLLLDILQKFSNPLFECLHKRVLLVVVEALPLLFEGFELFGELLSGSVAFATLGLSVLAINASTCL